MVAVLVSLLGACAEPAVPTAVITTDLTTSWDLLDHRLSLLEMTFVPDDDGGGGTIAAENEGGPFGPVDHVGVHEAFDVFRGDALRAVETSTTLVIEPSGATDPEQMVAAGEAAVDSDAFAGAEVVGAFIRGYRISTNDYDAPPAFATEIPYDPGNGFTSRGLGVQLGTPVVAGSTVTVPVSARVSHGPSDRADMNAALPLATTWIRVDIVLVAARGVEARATRGEVAYTLSTATYGKNTVNPHADDAAQEVVIAGEPGLATGITGLTGFDIWVNVPGRIDPNCVVVQDEINSWGEAVSGPGRYVTSVSTRLWDSSYDDASGQARVRADIYFSDSSMLKEVGNVCMGARAEVGLLQLAASTRVEHYETGIEQLQWGEVNSEPVRWADLEGVAR